ncbi:MAG: peptide chain release factor N(5)-glutamine methyltransferase [Candidatus Competibacteraceae bacterium]|jgi:release factor glutamine methyltransferase|nr:peptide chain release factor N(5)-glutamine methyltransferase [Candidatus Competibacteraceae bacterium]
MHIAALLQEAQASLHAISDTPRLDAEVLLSHALQQSRSYLHAWPERLPDSSRRECFMRLLERRLRGEPIAYLVEQREFWSLNLKVTPATLIPRPETELLVEMALQRIAAESTAHIADLGTGSGAIALAIAQERPHARLVATDRDPAALAVAQDNAQCLGLHNVMFRQGDWCDALGRESYAVIVSNPPYLALDDPHQQQGDLRFEPSAALVSGIDGLTAIRTIIAGASNYLQPGGWLLLEHGYDQATAVKALLQAQGFVNLSCHPDLAGIDRVSCGCWAG